MAKISSPIGQTIDVVATTVSRSVISGGGGRGRVPTGGDGGGGDTQRGGAIIVRPQTSLVDRSQNLQIQQTQQSVGGIQKDLGIIYTTVTELNNGIRTIAGLIQSESILEQNQLRRQQETERILTERKIRLGKESELERNITAALASPIVKLQKKVTSLFDRIMGALTTLFFGWLTNQGIETLKAFASGDKKKLEQIKNAVIKNVLFAVGAFAAVNIGFSLLMRSITGLTFRLATLTARIALAPFRAAGGLIAKILGIGGRGAEVAADAARTARAGRVAITGSTNLMTKFFNATRGLNIFGRGAGEATAKTAGRGVAGALPVLGTLIDVASAGYEAYRGNWGGAGLFGGAAITSLIPGAQGLSFGLGVAGLGQSLTYNPESKSNKETPSQPPAAQPTPTQQPSATQPAAQPSSPSPAAAPQTTMMPQASQPSFNIESTNQPTKTENVPQSLLPFDINFEGMQPPSELTPQANIQAPPRQQTPVGTLPEPKPNIITMGGGTDRTQSMIPQQQEPATDVPFIPSANIDNFYILYSQLNYNVVM